MAISTNLHQPRSTERSFESRDTATGANAWQPLTNIKLGDRPIVLEQPLDAPSRFYRGVGVP